MKKFLIFVSSLVGILMVTLCVGVTVRASDESNQDDLVVTTQSTDSDFDEFVDNFVPALITAVVSMVGGSVLYLCLKKKVKDLVSSNDSGVGTLREAKEELAKQREEQKQEAKNLAELIGSFKREANSVLKNNAVAFKCLNIFAKEMALFIASNPEFIKNQHAKKMLETLDGFALPEESEEVIANEKVESQQD